MQSPSGTPTCKATAWHTLSIVGLFSGLYALFFSPVILGDRILFPGDALTYYLPNFLSGIRLWEPLLLGGYPMAADPQAMTWYPLNLLFSYVLHSPNGFVISAYVLASCFTYGYVETLTGDRFASFLSGIVYGMSGFMMAHLGHTSIIHAAAWLPLTFWSLERLRIKQSVPWFLALTAALSCCFLAGHPQLFVYAIIVGGAYPLLLGGTAACGRTRFLLLFAGALLLALGIIAVQLLPTAELARLTVRAKMSFGDFVSYAMPPRQLVMFLFPGIFGTASQWPYGSYFGMWNIAEIACYVGILPLLLALVALTTRSHRMFVLFWSGVCCIALLLALGAATPLSKLAYLLPGVNKFRAPARHLLEVALAVSVLSGLGVRSLREKARLPATPVLLILALFGTSCLALFFVPSLKQELLSGTFGPRALVPWRNPAVGIPWVSLILSVTALAFWSRRTDSRRRAATLLTVLVLDLGSFGWFSEWRDGSPRNEELVPTPVAAKYRGLLADQQQRLLPSEGGLMAIRDLRPNISKIWGITSASGYGPLILSRVSNFLSMNPGGVVTKFPGNDNRNLDVFAVRYVVVPERTDEPAVSGPGGILWAKKDLGLSLGTGCGQTYSSTARFPLPIRVKASAIAISSSLGCSASIPDDAEVAQIIVSGPEGGPLTLSLRAGKDTSEWAIDCSDVAPTMRHRRAELFKSFPVKRMDLPPCEGHRYYSVLPFGREILADLVEIRRTGPPAVLGIEKMTLVHGTGFLPLPSVVGEVADASRWRSVDAIPGGRIFENLQALPRAWLVPEVAQVTGKQALRAITSSRMRDGTPFDPQRVALVEEPVSLAVHSPSGTAAAKVIEVAENRIEVQTDSSAPAFLVVSDVFYPGWDATVDDLPTRIYQTDFVLRGVVVPEGKHRVRFRFRPRSLALGAAISLSGLLAVLCMAASLPRRRGGRRSTPEGGAIR